MVREEFRGVLFKHHIFAVVRSFPRELVTPDPVAGTAAGGEADQRASQVVALLDAVHHEDVVDLVDAGHDLGVLHPAEGGLGDAEEGGGLVEGQAALFADLA
ncbi:hypothetical protein SM418_25590 [Actinomadura chokoriensis]|uniref:Uncharacterized protein n=1 Tax=Actinomadura chokoriensis TaxID=454156 RepID=A0ABV4R291_9ACTN